MICKYVPNIYLCSVRYARTKSHCISLDINALHRHRKIFRHHKRELFNNQFIELPASVNSIVMPVPYVIPGLTGDLTEGYGEERIYLLYDKSEQQCSVHWSHEFFKKKNSRTL